LQADGRAGDLQEKDGIGGLECIDRLRVDALPRSARSIVAYDVQSGRNCGELKKQIPDPRHRRLPDSRFVLTAGPRAAE